MMNLSAGELLYVHLSNSYNLVLLLVSVFAVFHFRKMDLASRIICVLIWIASITEVLAWYSAKHFHNNLPVYNIFSYFELAFISLYFNYSIDTFKKRNLGYYIAGIGTVLGILNMIFFQPITTLNSNFIFVECLCIVSMSLYSFYRLLLVSNNLYLQNNTHFWVPCVLIFYWCTTLFSWGMYDFFAGLLQEKTAILNICLLMVNIITYLAYATIFFLPTKIKNINE